MSQRRGAGASAPASGPAPSKSWDGVTRFSWEPSTAAHASPNARKPAITTRGSRTALSHGPRAQDRRADAPIATPLIDGLTLRPRRDGGGHVHFRRF